MIWHLFQKLGILLAGAWCFWVISLVPLLGVSRGDASGPKPWRVGVEADAAPLAFADEAGEASGFSADLARAVLAEIGQGAVFEVRPWPELYEGFLAGRYDMLASVSLAPGRERLILYSDPILDRPMALFYREDLRLATPPDFGKLRMATVLNSQSYHFLMAKTGGGNLLICRNIDEALNAVSQGLADALVATRTVGFRHVLDLGIKNISIHTEIVKGISSELHFGVHPGDQHRCTLLNQGLKVVKQKGLYRVLREQWFGPYSEKGETQRLLATYLAPVVLLLLIGVLLLFEQRRLLTRARTSEERLKAVLEASGEAFWDWDMRKDRLQVDERFLQLLELEKKPKEFIFRSLEEQAFSEDRVSLKLAREALLQGQDKVEVRFRVSKIPLEPRWLLFKGMVLKRDTQGRALRIVGALSDISAQKRGEEERAEALKRLLDGQRLEGLGSLAGGIAHDFNNLLTVIMSNASLVRLETPGQSPLLDYIGQIEKAAKQSAELCRQMLTYAGVAPSQPKLLQLRTLIWEMRSLLEVTVGKLHRLELELAEAVGCVLADHRQIRQVILSLVQNAAEACGQSSGVIKVRLFTVGLSESEVEAFAPLFQVKVGPQVCLEVVDSGPGIAEENLARVFEPFFTTKFSGRGLGLAAVQGIVRSHGGAIKVANRSPTGACFSVYLSQQT